jgi:imidazolonepropionase-like amidohydrolase
MKWLLAILLLCSCAVRAQPAAEGPPLALIHANIIDGAGDDVLRDATVLIRGGRIEAVGSVSVPPGVQVLDLAGHWLLPGLIDAHAHLFNLAGARRVLELGATTVRVLGTSHFVDVRMRELHAAGASDVPRVIASGYQIRPDVVDAFPDFLLDFPQMMSLRAGLHGPDDLRRVVRALAERRVDFIKILANERAGTPDTDPLKRTFDDEELRAIVDEARKLGLPVAAHAYTDDVVRAFVLVGGRTVEHVQFLSDATLALMKERGVCFDPTIATLDVGSSSPNPVLSERFRAMQPRGREGAARAAKAGVRIIAGTDMTSDRPTPTVADELVELVTAGMTPMQAIRAATSVAAECLGVEEYVGAIKPGLAADFVAVARDPLADIAALQSLALVVHDGTVVLNRISP